MRLNLQLLQAFLQNVLLLKEERQPAVYSILRCFYKAAALFPKHRGFEANLLQEEKQTGKGE